MPRTILVADDSVTIRRVVELTFAETDIRVETVGSGSEALDRFESLHPDLVMADVVMPEPSGYEICERVKASARAVPVILLAGTFEPFDPERAERCGADGHVVKPFDSRALLQLVERLLDVRGRAPAPLASDERQATAASAAEEVEAVLDDLVAEEPEIADLPVREAGAVNSAAPTVSDLPVEDYETSTEEEPEEPEESAADPRGGTGLDDAQVEAIVREVVARLSDRVLREIAWDVVPDLAETIIRERLEEIERGRS